MAAPKLGNGATFTYSGLTGNITSIEVSSYIRDMIESSHLGTTVAKTFIVDELYDPGTITVTGQMDTNVAYDTPATADTTATPANATVTWDTSVSMVAPATMTRFAWGSRNGEIQEWTAEFKLSGAITFDSTSAS